MCLLTNNYKSKLIWLFWYSRPIRMLLAPMYDPTKFLSYLYFWINFEPKLHWLPFHKSEIRKEIKVQVFLIYELLTLMGAAWGSVVVKALCCKSVGSGIDSKRWSLKFILWQLTFPWALGSTQPLKNEYQGIPGGKGGRCVRVTTLPPSCAECLVIWSLNRPEPSRPHKPVIGVALPFYWPW